MTERRFRFESGPIVAGLGLIALGALFILDQAGTLDAGQIVRDWWPVVIVAFGVGQLIERPRGALGPLIVVGVGLVLLATQLDLVPSDVWSYLWPALLVIIGLVIIFRWPRRGAAAAGAGDDVVSVSALFGSNEVVVTSQQFRGGSASGIFGGVVLDLRRAQLDPAGAALSVAAVFGGVDVIVPPGWAVVVSGTPIFGGLSNKVEPAAPGSTSALKVDVIAIFGAANIKHDK